MLKAEGKGKTYRNDNEKVNGLLHIYLLSTVGKLINLITVRMFQLNLSAV
jgi:hypothetical protein